MPSFFPCCGPNLAQVLWTRSRSSQRPPVLLRISSLLPHCVQVSKSLEQTGHTCVCRLGSDHKLLSRKWSDWGRCLREGRNWRGDTGKAAKSLSIFHQLNEATSWDSVCMAAPEAILQIRHTRGSLKLTEHINGGWIKEKRKENA